MRKLFSLLLIFLLISLPLLSMHINSKKENIDTLFIRTKSENITEEIPAELYFSDDGSYYEVLKGSIETSQQMYFLAEYHYNEKYFDTVGLYDINITGKLQFEPNIHAYPELIRYNISLYVDNFYEYAKYYFLFANFLQLGQLLNIYFSKEIPKEQKYQLFVKFDGSFEYIPLISINATKYIIARNITDELNAKFYSALCLAEFFSALTIFYIFKLSFNAIDSFLKGEVTNITMIAYNNTYKYSVIYSDFFMNRSYFDIKIERKRYENAVKVLSYTAIKIYENVFNTTLTGLIPPVITFLDGRAVVNFSLIFREEEIEQKDSSIEVRREIRFYRMHFENIEYIKLNNSHDAKIIIEYDNNTETGYLNMLPPSCILNGNILIFLHVYYNFYKLTSMHFSDYKYVLSYTNNAGVRLRIKKIVVRNINTSLISFLTVKVGDFSPSFTYSIKENKVEINLDEYLYNSSTVRIDIYLLSFVKMKIEEISRGLLIVKNILTRETVIVPFSNYKAEFTITAGRIIVILVTFDVKASSEIYIPPSNVEITVIFPSLIEVSRTHILYFLFFPLIFLQMLLPLVRIILIRKRRKLRYL